MSASRPGPRVAITGIGIVSAIGCGRGPFWTALAAGRSGVTSGDGGPCLTAPVGDFDGRRWVDGALGRRMDRLSQMLVAATRMAIVDAGLDPRRDLPPERTAIETRESTYTFLQLHEKVLLCCEHLAYLQVKKGTKVAVLMKNSMEMVIAIHALSYIGAVAVLLNTRLSREELLWQMEDAEVSCLLTDEEFEGEQVPVYLFTCFPAFILHNSSFTL